MRYAICNRQQAISKGFNPDTHRCSEGTLILNEREVMVNPMLDGETFDDRVTIELEGRTITEQEAITELNTGDWK